MTSIASYSRTASSPGSCPLSAHYLTTLDHVAPRAMPFTHPSFLFLMITSPSSLCHPACLIIPDLLYVFMESLLRFYLMLSCRICTVPTSHDITLRFAMSRSRRYDA
jgi:hypothetical protein